MEYFDRFNFEGDVEKARPDELLAPRFAEVLALPAKSGQELWHLHRGWFGELGGEVFLVNQNLDANTGQTAEGKPFRTVQIMTKIERRVANGTISLADFASLADKMQTLSKTTLVDVLNETTQLKIGI